MREKTKKNSTDLLLNAVAVKLTSDLLKTETKSLLISPRTINLSIQMPPSDDEWSGIRENIAKSCVKPNSAAILYTLVHNQLVYLGLAPDFQLEGYWPCEPIYKIDRNRHTYTFCNVTLRVSVLEEGPILIPLPETLPQTSPLNAEQNTDTVPDIAANLSSVNQVSAEGEYLYVLVELKTDPTKKGYVIKDISRTKLPLFTHESETNDRALMRDIRGVVTDMIKKFERCFNGKSFRSKEFSENGVEPTGVTTTKRKIDESSNSPECDVPERQPPLTEHHEELKVKFVALQQQHKPSKPARLAASLLTILRDVHKCALVNYNSDWLVPPAYKAEVFVFKYPSEKGVTPQECGYDLFNMTILWSGNDYFIVVRVPPEPSKVIVQKLVSGLVPKLGAESVEEEEELRISEKLKWYNLQQWLRGIDLKFLSKRGCGLYSATPTDSTPSTSSVSPSSR